MQSRFAFTAALLTLAASAAFADEQVTHVFRSSVPSAGVRRVVIDIPAGDVTVRNGAGPAVVVHGTVRRSYTGYRRRDRSQQIVDDSTVEISASSDQAVVRRRFGPGAQGWRAQNYHTQFNVTIEVPAGLDVDVLTNYGDVTFSGTFGNIQTDLRAGDIDLKTPRNDVRELHASVRVGDVWANLGDRSVHQEGIFPRTTHFYNATGRSTINLHATAGDVRVTLTQ